MSYIFIGQAFRIPGEANSPDLIHYNRIVWALHPLFAKKISLFSVFIKTHPTTSAKTRRRVPIPIGTLLHFPLFPFSWTAQPCSLYNARRRLKHGTPWTSKIICPIIPWSIAVFNDKSVFIYQIYLWNSDKFYIVHLLSAACLPMYAVLKWR